MRCFVLQQPNQRSLRSTSNLGTATSVQTTYQVRNRTGDTLDDLMTYYWTGEDIIDDVFQGDLPNNAITDKEETNQDEISIGFILFGITCLVTDDFIIQENTNNIFDFKGTTHFYCND
jgi:hypothetical protein